MSCFFAKLQGNIGFFKMSFHSFVCIKWTLLVRPFKATPENQQDMKISAEAFFVKIFHYMPKKKETNCINQISALNSKRDICKK